MTLLTCLRTDPKGLNNNGTGPNTGQNQNARAPKVWRVIDCIDTDSRWELLWRIRYERHPATAIICAGSPIMMPWKLATLALLPSKFLIINENADFFWLDRSQFQRAHQPADPARRLAAGPGRAYRRARYPIPLDAGLPARFRSLGAWQEIAEDTFGLVG